MARKPKGGDSRPRLEIVHHPIGWFKPYEANPRRNDKAVERMRASIREFGFAVPILARSTGEVIDGHLRLKGAVAEGGFTELPAILCDSWTPAQVKAFRLMANRSIAWAEWDVDLLAAEFADLKALEFDLTLTGFDSREIDEFTLQPNAGEDEVPPVPEVPVTKLGDLWLLGAHRLLCGDATDVDAVARLCGAAKADMVFTDPPYGINAVTVPKGGTVGTTANSGGAPFGGKGSIGGAKPFGRDHGASRKAIIQPNLYAPIIGDETTATAISSYKVCVDLGIAILIFWGANYYAPALPASRCWIVWDKENTGSFADGELAWTNVDKPLKIFRHQWSGLIKASERSQRRVHPTQKPIALAEWAFNEFGKEAKTVLDLFLGSGSTLIACEKTNRTCLGMELAPAYCDVIAKRWENLTGKKAVLESKQEAAA